MVQLILGVVVYMMAIAAGVAFQAIFRPPRFFHWRTAAGSLGVVILVYYSIGLGTHPATDPVELLGPWMVYGPLALSVVSGLVFTALHRYDDEHSEDEN